MITARTVVSGLTVLSSMLASQAVAQLSGPACPLAREAMSAAEAEFSYITDLAVDSEGRIYVADRFVHGVTVLRHDGSLSHRIGRAGDGPGEFRFVRNVSILPGDSVAAFDVQHGRLTVFAPGGNETAYTVNFPQAAPQLGSPRSVLLIPDRRRIIAQYAEPYRAGQARDVEPVQIVRVLDWTGRSENGELLRLPGPQSLVARTGTAIRLGMHPFGLPSLLRLGPSERLYFGRGDSLLIRIYDLRGEQVGAVRRTYQPPGVTEADLEWGLDQVSNALQSALRDAAPDRWPAFRQFVVDDSGRVWIGLDTPRGQPQVWAIMTDSGDMVCRALLDDDIDVLLVRGDRAYAAVRDRLDVPRIAIFEWRRTPE